MARPGDRQTTGPGEKGSCCLFLRVAVPLYLLLGWLTGCSQDNRRPADPLASAAGGSSIGSTAAPPVPVAPAVPPISVTGGGTASTAALASGAPTPLPGGTDLRIGNPNAGAWQGQAAATGATLQQPQPLVQPVSSVRGVAPAGPRATSYEQAMALLAAKGVQWRRLETLDQNQTQFSCSIPNPQNRFISRTYEARAANDLAAIQAVLDQIGKDSAGGP
jgi:hypothetical protein